VSAIVFTSIFPAVLFIEPVLAFAVCVFPRTRVFMQNAAPQDGANANYSPAPHPNDAGLKKLRGAGV
jgi:hypothetical protein